MYVLNTLIYSSDMYYVELNNDLIRHWMMQQYAYDLRLNLHIHFG